MLISQTMKDTIYLLQISVFAAYLYDAVLLYARALDAVLKENKSHLDGRAISMKMRSTSYESKDISVKGFINNHEWSKTL